MLSFEQLTQEALALPNAYRTMLIDKLLENLEFEPEIETAWAEEAKKRRDDIRSGAVQPISGEEAASLVRRLLNQ